MMKVEVNKILQKFRASISEFRIKIIISIVGFIIVCLVIIFAIPAKQKKDEFPGITANRTYLDALVVPLDTMPEWFYPYECPEEFRYSKEEILRMLPAPSSDFLEMLKAQRKAKVYEIISKGMQ
ncbi:MAG TPA: hypothetical protein P5519_03400 [Spirochaetia bacterium]|nr:hypothetical protein [Spirochaetales bacterium]HRS64914.1 hypothetical protein [Spirochaetia bacterium]HOT58034.1 hypothetical protein [Spirochaetales bacterium]HPD80120.1 hypothetical protein [Spirochaetales bacterium]HQK33766.1 hypothetical protein [Spirochaetales bacterium]